MKKNSLFAKITVYFLMFNIFFVLSSFCLGMLTAQPAEAAMSPVTVAMDDGCNQGAPNSPESVIFFNAATSHQLLPCCVGQNDQANQNATLQKIELTKQTILGFIAPVQSFLPQNIFTSYSSYYYSPPPNKLPLETIVIRV